MVTDRGNIIHEKEMSSLALVAYKDAKLTWRATQVIQNERSKQENLERKKEEQIITTKANTHKDIGI